MPPKNIRRPAARVEAPGAHPIRRGLRRPATPLEAEGTPWEDFGEFRSDQIPPLDLLKAGKVWITKAVYWKETTECVGQVCSFYIEGDETWVKLKLEGTKSEHLLKYITGVQGGMIRGHLCPDACGQELSADDLVHLVRMKRLDETRQEAWMSNLLTVRKEDDDLAGLREEAAGVPPGVGPPGKPGGEQVESKKKDKKKKEAKKADKRRRSPSQGGSRPKGGRDLVAVLGESGLDPDPSRRRRLMRKAKRIVRKNKKKKASTSTSRSSKKSSSSGTGSSEGVGASDVFGQSRMAKRVWTRCPGVLTATSLLSVQEQLLTTQGQMYDMDRRELPPIFLQYFRSHLSPKMQPAMRREAVHVSFCLDLGLQGRVPEMMDVLAQRLKALEGQTQGRHWSVTSQHELVPEEQGSVATAPEMEAAAREAREAGRLRSQASRPFGSTSGPEAGGDWRPETRAKGQKGQGKGKDWRRESKGSGKDQRQGKEGERDKDHQQKK